ncbi:hypothetical protein L484_024644 [Morus notabilis]|uniref:Uncharacterized protein n=1 Tax=Morus notabilis TaxID=981085 RepID=W9QRR1_9ROSA|nr:hypothetical protein L484_024644 [Morus notabilis]
MSRGRDREIVRSHENDLENCSTTIRDHDLRSGDLNHDFRLPKALRDLRFRNPDKSSSPVPTVSSSPSPATETEREENQR